MNVAVGCELITENNIFFYDEVENKVIPDSLFIQTGFSNELFSLSGIYITAEIFVIHIDRYFKRCKYILAPNENAQQIANLIKIEKMMLANLDRPHLTKIYRLKDQLSSLSVLVFDGHEKMTNKDTPGKITLILKISGIWITDNNCGITFKFFHIND